MLRAMLRSFLCSWACVVLLSLSGCGPGGQREGATEAPPPPPAETTGSTPPGGDEEAEEEPGCEIPQDCEHRLDECPGRRGEALCVRPTTIEGEHLLGVCEVRCDDGAP